MTKLIFFLSFIVASFVLIGQDSLVWKNVNQQFEIKNSDINLYQSTTYIDGKPNNAFYCIIPLNTLHTKINAIVGKGKRYTPTEYYNNYDSPMVVVNCTFFEFKNNTNLNIVINEKKILAYNVTGVNRKKNNKNIIYEAYRSAIGIDKKGKANIGWIFTNSVKQSIKMSENKIAALNTNEYKNDTTKKQHRFNKKYLKKHYKNFDTWKVNTAVGGGPVLVQNNQIAITNNEELLFEGKAIDDKHPRTAIGYTSNNELIILVVEGRNKGKADGVSLTEEAKILISLGCIEAMNLDGGGSSCMIVNGKNTIWPSDKGEQRAVPAVLILKR